MKRDRQLFKERVAGPFKVLIAAVLLLFVGEAVYANNLSIRNPRMHSEDVGFGKMAVEFDISWDNSWRNSINRDAVWLFVKYSTENGWRTATLSGSGSNPPGFSKGEGTGIDIVVPDDRVGCFIERSWTGKGTVHATDVRIVWDHSADNLSVQQMENINFMVIGIEMVYIPEGPFFAGDHRTSRAGFVEGSSPSVEGPWYIENSDAIRVLNISSGGYYYVSAGNSGEDPTGSEFIIPRSFPTGYESFYIMKYEMTEEQWVDFYNTLSYEARSNRDITGPGGKDANTTLHRNTIYIEDGVAYTLRPSRALSYISWQDLCAYADWAGLRPMTELEYEKASRGKDIEPVRGGYAWGSTYINAATTISGVEDGTETVVNSGANASYNEVELSGGDGGKGPLRAGIFATSQSNRVSAGASYYGVLGLSGNLWERAVTVGNSAGRAFQGSHGDGRLSDISGAEGSATNPDWPGYSSPGGVVSAAGSGFRGGSWLDTDARALAVSDRDRAAYITEGRFPHSGGRCVRTAP